MVQLLCYCNHFVFEVEQHQPEHKEMQDISHMACSNWIVLQKEYHIGYVEHIGKEQTPKDVKLCSENHHAYQQCCNKNKAKMDRQNQQVVNDSIQMLTNVLNFVLSHLQPETEMQELQNPKQPIHQQAWQSQNL